LIVALGDGVRDPAGAQRSPVGTAAVGLVAGQMRQALARPATPTGHPRLIHQPDQLLGVGVLAWSEAGDQVAATPVTDGVELGGQPTP
jgi:hypothetical protein